MSTKTINTRIGLKYDSYENWTKKGTWSDNGFTPSDAVDTTYWEGFKPLPGEVIFFSVQQNTGAVEQEPAILFKVGNGVNFLKDLPWGSAIAADVYAWAKQQSLLGGTYSETTGWSFGETDNATITNTRDEVAAFVKANTVNIRVRIKDLGNNQFQLQTTTSASTTPSEEEWVNAGEPFSFTQVTYSAGNGLSLGTETNKFSIKLKDGEDNLVVDENGLSSKVATVTYTAATTIEGAAHPANLTVGDTTGLLDETAVVKIKNYVDEKAGEATDASEVTLSTQETAESGFLSTYVLSQGGAEVGKINIPKDFLVKSASLVEATEENPIEGQAPGKYIKFVINSKNDTSGTGESLYLNVTELCEVYTANSQTGYVTLAIDSNNNITATAKTVTLENASAADGETPAVDGLATALNVKQYIEGYVGEQLDANVPNVEGKEAITVTDTAETTSKTVSLKLNDVAASDGVTEHVSGLKQSVAGLEINDTITWILNCGGAGIQNNQ